MARLRRRYDNSDVRRDLTIGQRLVLLYGFDFPQVAPSRFEGPTEVAAAWWRYRGELLYELGPFRRPDAFWWLEVGQVPDCPAGGNESQRDAILRLGLSLSPQEESILSMEGRISKVQEEVNV